MNHIDLFSGIGGFAFAAREVWGSDHEVVTFCEINKYAQQVLKKHWPDAPICEDIRKLDYGFIADTKSAKFKNRGDPRPGRNGSADKGEPDPNTNSKRRTEDGRCFRGSQERPLGIDLLTGGFPCQPFSNAGKRRGTEDDRYLWPEMLRVIKEFNPRWIVAENVAGIVNMAEWISDVEVEGTADLFNEEAKVYERVGRGILDGICNDIKSAGYEVQPFVIPACAVGAPHRRDRIWIVAHYAADTRYNAGRPECEQQQKERTEEHERCYGDGHAYSDPSWRRLSGSSKRKVQQPGRAETVRADCDDTNTRHERLERRKRKSSIRHNRQFDRNWSNEGRSWSENWLEVATRFCGVDDGLPVELDGFKLSKSKHREERLKALGNAIVPQVAMEIFKVIKAVDREYTQEGVN